MFLDDMISLSNKRVLINGLIYMFHMFSKASLTCQYASHGFESFLK